MNYNKICTLEEYLEESKRHIKDKYQISAEELINYEDEEIIKIIEQVYKEYWKREMVDTNLFQIENRLRQHYVNYTSGDLVKKDQKKGDQEKGDQRKKKQEQKEIEQIKEDMHNKIKNVLVHYGIQLIEDFRYQHYKLLLYSKNNGRYDGSDYKLLLETDFPFIKGEYELPEVGKELHKIIYGKYYINMLENIDKQEIGMDISRYGIKNMNNLIKEIEDSKIIKDEDCVIYIYLDELFGISLTNTIFWIVEEGSRDNKESTCEKDWGEIIKISRLLGKIQYVYLRNVIAQIVFRELKTYRYSRDVFECVSMILKESVDEINNYMDDVHRIHMCSVYTQTEYKEYLYSDIENIKNYLLKEIGENINFINFEEIFKYLNGEKEKRIKISKKKASKNELYALIHQNVMLGIKEGNL